MTNLRKDYPEIGQVTPQAQDQAIDSVALLLALKPFVEAYRNCGLRGGDDEGLLTIVNTVGAYRNAELIYTRAGGK